MTGHHHACGMEIHMKKSIRAIVTLAIVLLVCPPRPARAQSFKVGSFTKPTVTGNQTVAHGLGITPKALILWTDGSTTGTGGATSFWWAFGVTDGTTSASTGASSQNGAKPSKAARREANVALTIVQYDQTLQGEAVMQATPWDATNFYLNWTTSSATAYVIHYIAIGGTSVQAKAVQWNASAVCGATCSPVVPVSVTGVGFQPDVVLHFSAHYNSGLPVTGLDAMFMLGAMDAAGDQWVTNFWSQSGVTTTATARGQRTDASIEEDMYNQTVNMRGSFASMDADGWTVNFSNNLDGANPIFSLALKGLNLHVGSFDRSLAVGNQSVTGLGFQPGAVLFSSFQDVTNTTGPEANSRLGVGASDGTNRGTSTLDDKNGAVLSGSIKTTVQETDMTTKAFRVVNNDTASITAEAELTTGSGSLDSGGFTLNWTTVNDTTSATQILYLAMGPMAATAVTLESFKATRLSDGRTLLEWRTGYEVDNVGFRVYREQNGQRVRITSSLVPGSALIGLVGRGASTGGRTYTWSDTAAPPAVASDTAAPPSATPVQYWLEDLDLHGKSTWHGPISAASATDRESH
jgi:hypothetical protein